MKNSLILVATFASASLAGTALRIEYVCKPFNGNKNACFWAYGSCAKKGGDAETIESCMFRAAKEYKINSQDNPVKPDTAAGPQCQYKRTNWNEKEKAWLKETATISCSDYKNKLCSDCGHLAFDDCGPATHVRNNVETSKHIYGLELRPVTGFS